MKRLSLSWKNHSDDNTVQCPTPSPSTLQNNVRFKLPDEVPTTTSSTDRKVHPYAELEDFAFRIISSWQAGEARRRCQMQCDHLLGMTVCSVRLFMRP
jgi:hypothetical protein